MLSGLQFGNYLVKDFINSGSFGHVFEGEDVRTKRAVALKFLRLDPDEHAFAEFNTEDDILYRLLGSSNVIQRLDSGSGTVTLFQAVGTRTNPMELNLRYIVMELAEACLEEVIIRRDELEWPARLRLYRGVVKGVHQMHDKRIVHRDLKSGNCLIVRQRSESTAKVSDFGRSRDLREATRNTALAYLAGRGDIRFAPPELLWMQGFDNAQVWLLADLYGLGSLLFEIATGQGITAIALGSGADQQERVGRMPSDVRKAHFESQIPDMRGRYETALEIMEAELPRSIAHLTVGLVRQICDPKPERRLPNSARDPRHNQTGLEWLLRRVEIIVKTLETTEARGEEP